MIDFVVLAQQCAPQVDVNIASAIVKSESSFNPFAIGVTLKELVALTIDIIVHVEVKKKYDDESNLIGKERFISEIKFDPVSKVKAQFGDAEIIVGDRA